MQQQYVDVRVREQFEPTVATDREQCQRLFVQLMAMPLLDQNVIYCERVCAQRYVDMNVAIQCIKYERAVRLVSASQLCK